jgi:hypothetical protein
MPLSRTSRVSGFTTVNICSAKLVQRRTLRMCYRVPSIGSHRKSRDRATSASPAGLNRPNLIVLTNPRLLPFLSQIMEADPHLRYVLEEDGWYLVDKTTDTEYRSPMNHGEAADYAYIGRLPRPDGNGTFLYLAGTHAPGTLGAAHFVSDNITDLYREVKNRRFSVLVPCRYDPKDSKKIIATEQLTPIYRHDGA